MQLSILSDLMMNGGPVTVAWIKKSIQLFKQKSDDTEQKISKVVKVYFQIYFPIKI